MKHIFLGFKIQEANFLMSFIEFNACEHKKIIKKTVIRVTHNKHTQTTVKFY